MRNAHGSPALFTPSDRAFLQAVSALGYGNPFHPERTLVERAALGDDFSEKPGLNARRLTARLRPLLAATRERLARGAPASSEDLALDREACFHLLHCAHEDRLQQVVEGEIKSLGPVFEPFRADYDGLLRHPGAPEAPPPDEVFAVCLQVRRAFHTISSTLIGASRPMVALRQRVWDATFTVDMRDALSAPDSAMDLVPVLVTGPSGTGKDLVARSLGAGRRVPYDLGAGRLAGDPRADFHALHLMAQAETLLESSLFGHKRGAFTGAVADHVGWFEASRPWSTLFLDEIGTAIHAIQVKLLVVLESRRFTRVGDHEERQFVGRVVSATNENLAELVDAGKFRLDLYHRLCAVTLQTPSLRAQLDDAPGERRRLVRHFVGELRPNMPARAEALTDKVEAWLDKHLPDYAWPGNLRELRRCVCSVITMDDFVPAHVKHPGAARPAAAPAAAPRPTLPPASDPIQRIREGTVSEEEALRIVTNAVQARTRNVEETARLLGVHRNTVMRRIDSGILGKLMHGDPTPALPPGRGRRRMPR